MKYKVRSTKPVDAIRVNALLFPPKGNVWPDWIQAALKAGSMSIEGTACVVVDGNMDCHDDDAIVSLPGGKLVVLNADAFAAIYEPVPTK